MPDYSVKTLLVGTVLVLLLVGGGPYSAAAEQTCKQLIDTRCESCHYKTRICQVLGKKSKWGWKRSMKRMIQYGAKLTKAEQKTLTDCLVKARPGADFVCKYK